MGLFDKVVQKQHMEELAEELNTARDEYYNEGQSNLTDKQFDDKIEELRELENETGIKLDNSPVDKVGAPVKDGLEKFKHTYPAKSLDKTKDVDELINKFRKGIIDSGDPSNSNVVLMWKEDGATVQSYYKEGKLDKLVTRGDGEVGSIITHNASCISGLPLKVNFKGELVVRGEVVMSYEAFNSINDSLPADKQYKHPRNLAAASLSLLDPAETATRNLNLKAFNLVEIDDDIARTFSERLSFLQDLNFSTVEYSTVEINDLSDAISKWTETVSDYAFPVDGLVVAMDNYEYAHKLQGTEHHPHIMNGYALKWEDTTYKTVLRDIEWSPSRTGLLNPVAIFDAVDIDGVTVQRASLHNLSIMQSMRIRKGDNITVYRANLVIPQIDKNLDYDNEPEYTEEEMNEMVGYCPTCGSKVEVRRSNDGILSAYCPNEDCPEKMIGKLAHFCERDCMDIQGMSEETIKKLVDAGFIREYSDFFKLRSGIADLPGFGIRSWQKMCDASAEAQNTDFVKFITALSIPNIGKGQAKTLYNYLANNYDGLCDWCGMDCESYKPVMLLSRLADKGFDFSKIDGFGNIMADALSTWLKSHFSCNSDTPEMRVYSILKFTDQRPVAAKESSITGKSFCITGKLITFKNRQELVAKIEEFGGKWIDSVSSKTDYLINNDVNSTSGKNKKAKDLNIPIISEEDFLGMVQ